MAGAYRLIENYIYIYQLDKYIILPVYPEQLTDNLGSQFAEENILSRTAPVYSYSHSGPRTVQFNFQLHRDLMNSVNASNLSLIDKELMGTTNLTLSDDINEMLNRGDYTDILIRYLQAMALPAYEAVESASSVFNSMVKPPMIAVRLGTTVFIKGIINGDVSVTYSGPITKDGKYMQVDIGLTVTEIEPQDAETISKWGSYRSLGNTLTRGLYK